jgi:hypothetical protein
VSLHENTMLETEAFETEFADFDDLGDAEDWGAQHNRARSWFLTVFPRGGKTRRRGPFWMT